MTGPTEAKFWANTMPNDAGCWIWLGTLTKQGYGYCPAALRPIPGLWPTHRIAYTLANGPIPDGLVIDHLCRVRACCNPVHLEAVTNAENVRRAAYPTITTPPRTHCKNGHQLTPENTYVTWGYRKCRTCARDYYSTYTRPRR